jgi:anti-sigma factor RsiW
MPKDGGANKGIPMDGIRPEDLDSCPDALTLASYLDGKMEDKEQALLEYHLTRCAKCAKDVSELPEIIAQVELGPDHSQRVREVVERGKKILDS